MFRKRQDFKSAGSGAITEIVRKQDSSGRFVEKRENVARNLPDVETTDLEALIKAGVSLEQVSTKILQPDFTNVKTALNKTTKPENKEVNDAQ